MKLALIPLLVIFTTAFGANIKLKAGAELVIQPGELTTVACEKKVVHVTFSCLPVRETSAPTKFFKISYRNPGDGETTLIDEGDAHSPGLGQFFRSIANCLVRVQQLNQLVD